MIKKKFKGRRVFMKKIAILQPNYIPWKGVFDLINKVDVFVFYDDVQYTKKDWRNRNKIKTKNGDIWITVPVVTKGHQEQLIVDTHIDVSSNWQHKHYKTIRSNYAKAKYFDKFHYILEEIYLNNYWTRISDLNIFSTKLIAEALNINTRWVKSSDLQVDGSKDGERAIKICKQLECDYFINGPASKEFLNEELFIKNDIELVYMDYSYKEYEQLYKPFSHNVSVLDVLFNCGENAPNFIFSR